MPDYNLSGLSTRSFEQLIQALSIKLFGPGVVVFGDGPDGGREATIEGPMNYAPKGERWSGYLVVQAKFRQRTEGTAKDVAWALDQLASELKKFATRTRKLRKPEYYLFATNVILTPTHKSGGKDRAYATIRKYRKRFPLKDFDIWDYDKLRVYLDDSEEIRHAYAAWITPGDVLAEVMSWLRPQQPDFEKVLANFLQKEMLADQYANLEQAGHSLQDRIPLATVFVDLPASNERANEPPEEDRKPLNGFVSEVLSQAGNRFDSETLSTLTSRESRAKDLPSPGGGKFVLIGGPGQGKTTICQFMCQLFRAAILRKKQQRTLADDIKACLKEIDQQCASEDICLPAVRRFPIRIALSEFAKALASTDPDSPKTLLGFISGRIKRRTDQSISKSDLHRLFETFPWLLILDGLDEVPASSNRSDVLNAIRDFWVDVAESNADVLVIATTRPQGYSEDFSPSQFEHKWLVPLSPKRALHYSDRLVRVRYRLEQDRQHKVLERLRRACQQAATARLMRSPLQVTIMAALVDRVGQPPQERWSLFRQYYDVIYEREMERDILPAKILREYKPDVDSIHARVGLMLQVESERAGMTDARLSLDRFADIVEDRLTEEGHQGRPLEDLRRQIMEAAAARLVFLVGVEEGKVGFEIRSLQEFMAAEGLTQGADDELRARLRAIAPVANWRNVFLFGAGKCFAERQHLRDTIHTICVEINDDPDPSLKAARMGSQLALDLLEDGPARRQPRYAHCLLRLAMRLLDLPADDYSSRLAALYSPELEALYRDELENRLSQGPHHKTLGAWGCLFYLMDRGVSWAASLADKFWPNDEQHLSDLLQVGAPCESALTRLVDLIPQQSPYRVRRLLYEAFPPAILRIGDSFSWLSALTGVLQTVERYEARFPLTVGHSGWLRLRLGRRLGMGEPIEESLEGMPTASPEWSTLLAGDRSGRSPGANELARQLDFLSAQSSSVPHYPWSIPWPLAACVQAARSGSSLDALAARASRGELGDLAIWLEAEARWAQKGVSAADLIHMTDARWPFDSSIAQIGFPLGVADLELIGLWPEIEALLGIYDGPIEARARSVVANWIGDAASYTGRPTISGHLMERLRPILVTRYDGELLPLSALVSLFPDGFDEEWADDMDRVATRSFVYGSRYSPPNERFLQSAVRAFLNAPRRIGMLRILAETAEEMLFDGLSAVPPELLAPGQFAESRDKVRAICLRLARGVRDDSELRELAEVLATLPGIGEFLLRPVLEIVRVWPIPAGASETLVLQLLGKMPPEKWENAQMLLDFLNNLLRRRTSGLEDASVWSNLKLPRL